MKEDYNTHNQNCPCSLCYSLIRGGGAGSTSASTHLPETVSKDYTERRLDEFELEMSKAISEIPSAGVKHGSGELLLKYIDVQNVVGEKLNLIIHQAHQAGRESVLKDVNERMEAWANLEHERWAKWQIWCHKVLRENCPSPELEKVLERWDRQIATPYAELSEAEKESDREQVRPYFADLADHIKKTV